MSRAAWKRGDDQLDAIETLVSEMQADDFERFVTVRVGESDEKEVDMLSENLDEIRFRLGQARSAFAEAEPLRWTA